MHPRPSTHGLLSCTALLLASLVAVSAQAQVVISNLGETTLASAQVRFDKYIAQSFTTSAGWFSLDSVSVRLNSAINASGSFFLGVATGDVKPLDDLGSGGFIHQLTGTDNPAANGTYTFTTTGLIVQPTTTYWLVMGVDAGAGNYRWYFPNSTAFQTSTWTVGSVIGNSADQGDTWELISGFNPYMFSISATAIPEPSTYAALAGIAALGIAIWRKRRMANA